MRKIRISEKLALPLDAVTERIAIIAMSGMGKTYTSHVMAEEMLDCGQQIVLVDPKHDSYGLRSKYKILIFGGKRGDIPLSDTSGALIAQFIVSSGRSVILDLDGMSISAQKRFMCAFMEEMYRINENPIHIFIDEADEFIPQKPNKGDERMLGAGKRLAKQGRSKGIGVTLITQRTAEINKGALNQCGTLIMHGMMGVQDLNVVEEYLKRYIKKEEREKILKRLVELEQGVAIVYSPRWLKVLKEVKIRKKYSFDSSATPQAGKKRKAPKRLAKIDLSKLKDQMKATVEHVASDNPKLLKKKIAELQVQILRLGEKKPAPKPETVIRTKTKIKMVKLPVLRKMQIRQLATEVKRVQKIKKGLTKAAGKLEARITSLQSSIDRIQKGQDQAVAKVVAASQERGVPVQRVDRVSAKTSAPEKRMAQLAAPKTENNGAISLVKGEKKILQKAVDVHPVRLTIPLLARRSDFTPKSGTFQQYLRHLRKEGLLIMDSEKRPAVTPEAFAYLGVPIPAAPETSEQKRGAYKSALVKGERALFEVLEKNYPEELSYEELAKEGGFSVSSGTFQQYVRTIKRNGIFIEQTKGKLRMSDEMFQISK